MVFANCMLACILDSVATITTLHWKETTTNEYHVNLIQVQEYYASKKKVLYGLLQTDMPRLIYQTIQKWTFFVIELG